MLTMRYLGFLLSLFCLPLFASPVVVTSIKPLQEISEGIMAGVAKPDLIISEQTSAHHFALRPSHMRLIQKADLLIWVDRHFESGFNRIPDVIPESVAQLELLPRLQTGINDGHIWYSPSLLIESITLITGKLAQIDPANEALYRKNALQLSNDLKHTHARLKQQLTSSRPSFITDHDFLQHFVREFDLDAVLSVHDHHDDHGGLGELQQIETHIKKNRTGCLLSTESRPTKLGSGLVDKYQLQFINIVPGVDTNPVGNGILRRLDQLTDALKQCRAMS